METHLSTRFEKLIPLAFFLVFVAITIPGITWGAPGFWHPDEIIQATDRLIERGKAFDQENFDYPSLPKYVHYGIALAVYKLGYSKIEFIQAARLVSVLLGGAVVALTYKLTRLLGGGFLAAGLAALLVLSNRDFALYFRFAHNDPYLVFFTTLCVIALLLYRLKSEGTSGQGSLPATGKFWLYAAFFCVGLAASSKYNGASLMLAVLVVHLVTNWSMLIGDRLAFFEMVFIGGVLSGLGYALGTPTSLFWMAFYFKRAMPYILRHATYNKGASTPIGLAGQWDELWGTLGAAIAMLFLVAIVWYGAKTIRSFATKTSENGYRSDLLAIIFLCILAIDLPIVGSYHYPARFFLALIPLLSALAGLLLEEMFRYFSSRAYRFAAYLSAVALLAILAYSFLRVLGVGLLFLNDNRIAAAEFLKTLRQGKTIEYTQSNPNIPEGLFSEEFKHPIQVVKYENQPPPERNPEIYNQGEAGVEAREPDYLVVDSFTYRTFDSKERCDSMPLECAFFRRLFAGETNYELLRSFDYSLPPYLPDRGAPFVNPVIKVYQRKGTSGTSTP